MNKNCNIVCRSEITIGDDCMFGESVSVYDHDHDISVVPFRKDRYVSQPVYIGNNVWIGCHAFVGKGVTIGDNVVIGAGSIVTKDIPGNSVFTNKWIKPIS